MLHLRRLLLKSVILLVASQTGTHGEQVRAEEAAARSANASIPLRERLDAFQTLSGAKQPERDDAYRNLVQDAEQTIAVEAAKHLIYAKSLNIGALIASHIGRWSDQNQMVVLYALLSVGADSVMMEIPREELWDCECL
jgi:hypothetical protein